MLGDSLQAPQGGSPWSRGVCVSTHGHYVYVIPRSLCGSSPGPCVCEPMVTVCKSAPRSLCVCVNPRSLRVHVSPKVNVCASLWSLCVCVIPRSLCGSSPSHCVCVCVCDPAVTHCLSLYLCLCPRGPSVSVSSPGHCVCVCVCVCVRVSLATE